MPKVEAHLVHLSFLSTRLSKNGSVKPLNVIKGAIAMKTLILSLIYPESSDKAVNIAAVLSEYPTKATLSYPV